METICSCDHNATLDAETRSKLDDVCALCIAPAPPPSTMECSCAGTYMEDDEGNCTTSGLCWPCLVKTGHCTCTAAGQCEFCTHRDPFPITEGMVTEAAAQALAIYTYIDVKRAQWRAEKEAIIAQWEHDYLDLHWEEGFPCSCRACLLSPAAHAAFNETFRAKFEDILEIPVWYDAWQSGNPDHADPTQWCCKGTWKLLWNAKRL